MPGGRYEACVFFVSDKVTVGAYTFQLRVKIHTSGFRSVEELWWVKT